MPAVKAMLTKERLFPILTLVAIFPLWEFVCRLFDIPNYLLPSPTSIFEAFVKVEMHRWMDHLLATMRIAILGFFLSLAISLPLAIAMVQSRFLSMTLFPILVVVQSTPVVAIAPLLIVIMGAGDAPRLAITCLITFFPLVVSATTGMLETPSELIDLSRSLKGSAIRRIFQIRLPYAIPHIFSGLKVAITLSIIGAVISEFVAAEKGLGYFVQFSTSYFKIPQAFAALMFLSVISLILFQLVSVVQKIFFAWSIPETTKH